MLFSLPFLLNSVSQILIDLALCWGMGGDKAGPSHLALLYLKAQKALARSLLARSPSPDAGNQLTSSSLSRSSFGSEPKLSAPYSSPPTLLISKQLQCLGSKQLAVSNFRTPVYIYICSVQNQSRTMDILEIHLPIW